MPLSALRYFLTIQPIHAHALQAVLRDKSTYARIRAAINGMNTLSWTAVKQTLADNDAYLFIDLVETAHPKVPVHFSVHSYCTF